MMGFGCHVRTEYGTDGIVSTRGAVYSYGIMLMETSTKKKPTDEMSLKHWVSDSLLGSKSDVVDSNLLGREEEHFEIKKQCASSVLGLAVARGQDQYERRCSETHEKILIEII